MIMKKLTKEKQMHLVIVAVATIAIIAGLWFGLITLQQAKIKQIAGKSQTVLAEIEKEQKMTAASGELQSQVEDASNRLSRIEGAMPSGDLFSWIVSSLKQFNVPTYKVEMPQISAPLTGGVRMFPEYPYNEATVSVSGTAYYYEFGKFLADLENHFPYLRVQNLLLEPGFGTTPEEREKLTFHMEIVTLINKPNS